MSAPDEDAPRRKPRRTGPRTEPRDLMTAICEAVDELFAAGPGDILVFLSGEREIRDAEDALRVARDERLKAVRRGI